MLALTVERFFLLFLRPWQVPLCVILTSNKAVDGARCQNKQIIIGDMCHPNCQKLVLDGQQTRNSIETITSARTACTHLRISQNSLHMSPGLQSDKRKYHWKLFRMVRRRSFFCQDKKKAAKPKVIQLRAGNTVGGRRRISFCSCVSRSLGAAVTPLHRIFPPTSPGN